MYLAFPTLGGPVTVNTFSMMVSINSQHNVVPAQDPAHISLILNELPHVILV